MAKPCADSSLAAPSGEPRTSSQRLVVKQSVIRVGLFLVRLLTDQTFEVARSTLTDLWATWRSSKCLL